MMHLVPMSLVTVAAAGRTQLTFDYGWKFKLGDPSSAQVRRYLAGSPAPRSPYMYSAHRARAQNLPVCAVRVTRGPQPPLHYLAPDPMSYCSHESHGHHGTP